MNIIIWLTMLDPTEPRFAPNQIWPPHTVRSASVL